MTLITPEFKDLYNVSFGKDKKLEGQLSLKQIKADIKRIQNTVQSFDNNPTLLNEYLQRASASSDTEVLSTLYIVLTGNSGFEKLDKHTTNVLLKWEPYLRVIKQFNKPTTH